MSITPEIQKSNAKLARYYCHELHCDCETLSLDESSVNCQISPTKCLELDNSEIIGCTALHLAVRTNNASSIKFLLDSGADPMIRNRDGLTPLQRLVLIYDFQHLRGFYHIKYICKLLLSAQMRSGNVENPKDKNGFSHFHIACMADHTEAIEFFLKSGVSVNEPINADSPDFPGYSPLHLAARYFALQATEMLLEFRANTQLKNTAGITFLCMLLETITFAMKDDKLKMMNFLLHTSSYPIDSFGLTHFHIACYGKELSIVERLLPSITDINHAVDVDAPRWAGFTALHFAATSSIEMVKVLMKNGANIVAKDAKGMTPLDMCIEKYGAEDVHAILSLDDTCRSILMSDEKTKLSSLILAMKNTEDFDNFLSANTHIVNVFVPLDAPVWQGHTPLHIAVRLYENSVIIEELMDRGADINAQDIRGRSPIHLAFQNGPKDPSYYGNPLTNLLLDYHDEIVDAVDDDNLSHLHIACRLGRAEVVANILQTHVDVNLAFKGQRYECCVTAGSTPLHCAASSRAKHITGLLLSRGADPYLKNASGMTAIHSLIIQWENRTDDPMSRNALLCLPNLQDAADNDLGLSHLHVAVLSADVAAAEELLNNGADVNRAVLRGELPSEVHPLHYIRAGDTPLDTALRGLAEYIHTTEVCMGMLELLLRRGAEVLIKDPISIDLREASAKLNRFLSLLSVEDELFGRLEKDIGLTLLHVACSRRDYELIEALLESGADVNAQISEKSRLWPGGTALHILMDLDEDLGVNELSCMKMILRASKHFAVNPTRLDGLSHFHVACSIGDVVSVRNFLKNGVVVNQPTDFFSKDLLSDSRRYFIGCTPLHFAAASSRYGVDPVTQLQVVDLLLNHGADVNAEDVNGDTPLHFMAVLNCEREDVILRMVKSEANVNSKNARNETPLEVLMRTNENITVENIESYLKFERLLNDGMDRITIHSIVSKRNKLFEMNPALSAAQYIRFIRVLEQFECNVDDQDSLGRTPLHLAVLFRNIEAIQGLLLAGADVNVTDATGKTAFSCLFHSYSRSLQKVIPAFSQKHILSVFVIHMKKLLHCGLDVIPTDQSLMTEALEKFHFRDVTVPTLFEDQIREIKHFKVAQTTLTLGKFLSETDAVIAYATLPQTQRDAVDKFFKNEIYLRTEYSEVASILLLQYRKAVKRVELNLYAQSALNILSRLPLSHLCSEPILRFLSNSELCNMTEATISFV